MGKSINNFVGQGNRRGRYAKTAAANNTRNGGFAAAAVKSDQLMG